MATARGVLVLLALVFLVFAVWWAVLSLPAAFKSAGTSSSTEGDAQKVGAVQGFNSDARTFDTAVVQAQASQSGVDADTLKLRETMKQPENAAHYDKVIRAIRAFNESNADQRARIEAKAEENGDTLLAPLAFEAIDKYALLCDASSAVSGEASAAAAAAAQAVSATAAAAAAAVAAAASDDEESEAQPPHCGKTTVREIVADNLSSMLFHVDSDADKAALHKAYIAGLDQSIAVYLDGKTARESLFAMPATQVARTLVSAYGDQFSEKLNGTSSDDSSTFSKLTEGLNPLALIINPFFAGTVAFLLLFAYLMMMLSLTRVERRLAQMLPDEPAPGQNRA